MIWTEIKFIETEEKTLLCIFRVMLLITLFYCRHIFFHTENINNSFQISFSTVSWALFKFLTLHVKNNFVPREIFLQYFQLILIQLDEKFDEIDDEHVQIDLGYGSEGTYFGRPKPDQIAWMKENRDEHYDLWYVYFSFEDEVRLDFNNSEALAVIAKMALEPPESGVVLKSFDCDYHFPEDVDDFIRTLRNEW